MQEKNDKEIQMLKNRLKDLAAKSFRQNIFTFTDFLGLAEQDLFWQMEREFAGCGFKVFGGREQADRVMVRFGNPEAFGYEVEFPFVCVHIRPLNQKFADDLSHRDFLGALMNLGMERSCLGDIVVGEKEAHLFCLETMAEYICENLTQVRHTQVSCNITTDFQELPQEEPKKILLQVNSPRVDALIAKIYNLSREESLRLFAAGKVFVNGRLCESNAKSLKVGDAVNARGFGKFIYLGEKGETRKGKTNVEAAVYK